ncbi:MAG: DUF1700 domain-containing protein [Geminicoccaceae bacterium]
MTKDTFLHRLRQELADLPQTEVDEILADYSAYFEDAETDGRPMEDVAQALGDPKQLARELRAEMGLRRWERDRTTKSLVVAVLALGGLALVYFVVLLPLLLVIGLVLLVVCLTLLIVSIVGFGKLLSLLTFGGFPPIHMVLPILLTGTGLVAASIGGGALLLLCLHGGMDAMARYVRLHYRLLQPIQGESAGTKAATFKENER